ncbi:MAG: Ig-like domain repeat protein, partial [Verrucomicrobiota bacterium]
MKSSPTTHQARLCHPDTAGLANSSHDAPNVMPPVKPLCRMLIGLAAAMTLGIFVTAASAQQMITNGSFEVGDPVPGNSGQLSIAAGNTAKLPGWTANTGMGWYFRATAWGMTAPDGAMAFNLISQTGIYTLSQSFAVTAGDTYTVSYYEKRRGYGGYMDTTVKVAGGTVSGAAGSPVAVAAGPAASIVQTTAANAAWTLHSFTFTADTTTTATITFGNHYGGGQGDNDGVFLDNVSVLGSAVLTATTTTLARSSGTVTPSTYGDSLSFDVTLDPATATGDVELHDGGASGTVIGIGALSSGTCTITPATNALAVGPHPNIVAVYLGDTTYATSTSAALTQVVSGGAATALLFTTSPCDAQPGDVWTTQPTVKVLDASGNIAGSSASITLAITSATPTSGGPGTLIGTKTVTAVNGVATFSGLSIDTAGMGYRLTATSADLTSADSALFTISSGTVLYDSTACSGQFPSKTLNFTPVEGHVYTLSFSLNNPDA